MHGYSNFRVLTKLPSCKVVGKIIVIALFCTAVCSRAADSQGDAAVSLQKVVDRYCVVCHNEKLMTGGIALNKLSVENVSQAPDVWEKVVRMVRARYMPPAGMPRPDEKEYKLLVQHLETSLDKLAAEHPNPGRTESLRRLNRTEYHNAVRDLLGVDVDVESLLPPDDSSHGFDNITVGELPPALLERYLNAAKKISRLAVGATVPAHGGATFLVPPDLTQDVHFDQLPFGTRGGALIRYTFPQDGIYEIQARLTRDRNENVEGLTESAYVGRDADKLPAIRTGQPNQLEVTLDDARISLFTIVPPVPSSKDNRYRQGGGHDVIDRDFNVRVAVKAGTHALAATFLKHPSDLLETEREPHLAHVNFYESPRIGPALYSISVTGPFNASGPGDTVSRRRIFVCYPKQAAADDACAQRIIETLVRRAYRRPARPGEVQAIFDLYKKSCADGGFDGGIEMAVRAILVSPQFLFHIETDPQNIGPNTVYHLNDFQLASRLSFFLWSSIPDDELLELAAKDELHVPHVLRQQVLRMLADRKSDALVYGFADQWLYLRNLDSTSPNPRLFPNWDDNLRQSLRRETELFFESIMRDDRNVLDLLRANYTYLNERLAKHYDIPGVYGSQFRRVSIPADNPRRGLLGQGSILAVTSYPNRTSPVRRGKWVLANLLDMPPPPPPPNVPALKESAGSGRVLTMRERMTQHRANPVCASCHRLMDPIGFSLENYDAVGQWRNKEGDSPVDASGNLPDGVKFVGASGLQSALLERPELFVIAMTEKLLTYALGRGLEYYDAPAVRHIVQSAGTNDDRFSSLVFGIVNSTPFEMRRSQ